MRFLREVKNSTSSIYLGEWGIGHVKKIMTHPNNFISINKSVKQITSNGIQTVKWIKT